MNVSALILAAGRSTRFEGGHKLLAKVDCVPIVRCVALAVAQSNVGEILLVVGARASDVTEAAGPGRWRSIENRQAADGMASSIRCGLQNIDQTIDGVLIALGDMPQISATLINILITAFADAKGSAIVFPVASDGRRGHPIIWPRALIPELERLSGDTGGSQILERYRDLWRPVHCTDVGAYTDIDTSAELDALRLDFSPPLK